MPRRRKPKPRRKGLRICVIGLGYVGLPLAVALARHFDTIGFDINRERAAALCRGIDRTREVSAAELRRTRLRITADEAEIAGRGVYIITVPTPVDAANRPDLGAVRAACRTVGRAMKAGAIVVLESTVYPGVTEDVCGAEIEAASGLRCGNDFFLGYSPERINPGDRQHTIERITKVVAGQTPEITRVLEGMYGRVTGGKTFAARSIKVAEAAKVIENAQRDINIAFINEVTVIFNKIGLSIQDVLAASATKWNFLRFYPGLVGGHCIGVDPFYLASMAQALGHHPEVILAGRRINDRMGAYVVEQVAAHFAANARKEARVLVLGLTFKENIPDIRNSKAIDIVRGLEALGHKVDVHDPLADPEEVRQEYQIDLLPTLAKAKGYDCVVGAVAHETYQTFGKARLETLLARGGLLADVKGIWSGTKLAPTIARWQL